MNDDCETCNVPGPCNPRHVDCTLTDDERRHVEMDRDDEEYHSAADTQHGVTRPQEAGAR